MLSNALQCVSSIVAYDGASDCYFPIGSSIIVSQRARNYQSYHDKRALFLDLYGLGESVASFATHVRCHQAKLQLS